MTVKYGGYFEENGFVTFTSPGVLKVGKVFPYMAYVPDHEYGKAFRATNYPELHGGTEEKKVYTDIRGDIPPVYVVMPVVVGYENNILPNRVEDGKIIYETGKGFSITTSGISGVNTGHMSSLFAAIRKEGENFTLEILGYLRGNDISYDLNSLPEEIRNLVE